ncbi:MAG TPA: hypothetical protein VIQ52_09300 [Arthrobacter sp.]
MPYPSPITFPSPSLYPGFATGTAGRLISLGGLVLGQWDERGVKWSVNKFEGWDGSTASTTEFTQRARGHGATTTEGFYTPRFLTIEGNITAPNLALLDESRDMLNAAVTLRLFQMLVSESGQVRNMMVKRQGAVVITPITDTTASYSVLLGAPDPRKYGDLVTDSTLLPFSSGGLIRPSMWPRTWTGVSGTGVIRIRNEGNEQAPVWLRIDGPVPAGGWAATHIGKQQSLTFANALELAAGEFVTVDMDRREVLAQGQSARSGYVTSRGWFSLDPGDNDIAFSAQNYSPTALLTVTTKPAWS